MGFHWGNPVNWFKSRRHVLAYIYDTTDAKRASWVELQRRSHPGNPDFRLDRSLPDRFSFLVWGDSGEGDSSQIVLLDKILREGSDCEFAAIASDVIYPSGRSQDYREKFYRPYRNLRCDIYAVPGNHDWYDELVGFMTHMCAQPLSPRSPTPVVDQGKVKAMQQIRRNRVYQPNMYFYIDSPSVRILFLDSGIRGRVDRDQLAWLDRVAAVDKQKVVIMGDPIYSYGKFDDDLRPVNDLIVKHRVRLVIAGDHHNYQKYRIRPTGWDRDAYYIVSGGGGAFLHRTHNIPAVREMGLPFPSSPPSEPDDFDVYPDRETSRKWYPSRVPDWVPDAFVDRDEPPYHKHFLKLTVDPSGLTVEMFPIEEYGEPWVSAPAARTIRIEG